MHVVQNLVHVIVFLDFLIHKRDDILKCPHSERGFHVLRLSQRWIFFDQVRLASSRRGKPTYGIKIDFCRLWFLTRVGVDCGFRPITCLAVIGNFSGFVTSALETEAAQICTQSQTQFYCQCTQTITYSLTRLYLPFSLSHSYFLHTLQYTAHVHIYRYRWGKKTKYFG